MRYQQEGTPLVVIAGKEYGTGSSRDWAAKGTTLQGIKAVVAQSFERIHRSNLVGMGVLPVQFPEGVSKESLGLTGDEKISLLGLASLKPRATLKLVIERANGDKVEQEVIARVDTNTELEYLKSGGILHHVLRGMIGS